MGGDTFGYKMIQINKIISGFPSKSIVKITMFLAFLRLRVEEVQKEKKECEKENENLKMELQWVRDDLAAVKNKGTF
jgi:hypothetical protein